MIRSYCISVLLTLFLGQSFAQNDLNVYVFIAEDCPISIYMAKPLQDVSQKFGPKATFYAVFPSILSTTESAELFLEEYNLPGFNIRLDPNQELTDQLSASVTPEAIITDRNGEILYRGRITDAFVAPGKMKHGARVNVLNEAIGQVLNGKKVPLPWVAAVGCYISYKPKSDD